ncbi:MAG TPA: metal ABC transporter permease [Candidatus Dormibacteraeota bacterium]|nr:metal ABC transporter permease [Candidatus Dormibacteraeota bacterium]
MTELITRAVHLAVTNTAPQPSWNPLDDLAALFQYEFMVHAFEAGTIIAIVAGAIGYFVVLRGSAFAAHALSHIGFAGATAAVVLSLNPIFGLLAFTLGAGIAIGALGNRLRSRDVTIGIVLAWTLGLGVLFISLYKGYATEAYALLFGEILGISASDVTVTLVAGVITIVAVVATYRPLLFSSVDEDLAAAKGVPVTALSIAFMAILAVAVTEAVQVVGVLLIFALIVTPAAIAVRFTSRPALAIATGIALALAFTWLGLAIAFYSPHPVSFFITSLAFGTYVGVRIAVALQARIRRSALSATA